MLRQPLSSKNFGFLLGGLLLLFVLVDIGIRFQQGRNTQSQEAHVEWQRDREMGVPDTGLSAEASPEEREQARHRAQEEKMTQERAANP